MRQGGVALLILMLWLLVGQVTTEAAQLTTFEAGSRFVDPAKVRLNPPPPGVAPRPNALRVNVFLPDGYDGKRRFPVLYLLHGYSGTYDIWAHPQRGDILNTARGFPALIIMPEGGTGFYANWWNGGRRGDPAWERFYLEELIPEVERRFQVRRGRRWHAIAGLSMGGQGAMGLASRRPDYFGAVASFSGPLSIERPDWKSFVMTAFEGGRLFGDPLRQAFYWRGHNPTALVANLAHLRIYVANGDGVPRADLENPGALASALEILLRPHSEDFVRAARANALDVTWRPHQGVHWYPYWRQDLRDAILSGCVRGDGSTRRWLRRA
jgi:S-formylglutathione hydrolase FrmB